MKALKSTYKQDEFLHKPRHQLNAQLQQSQRINCKQEEVGCKDLKVFEAKESSGSFTYFVFYPYLNMLFVILLVMIVG